MEIGIVKQINVEEEMRNSYLDYAMSVIISRALPDVRDGLKPSQRRILVAMHDLNLAPGRPYRKCAKIAGDTSGNYHPHGESVIYPTLVRLAQTFNMRYPLVDGQGNFGSVDGDPPAAMRYTESRMTPLAVEMLADIDKDTVDWNSNYDGTRNEPSVLPGRFPNLICNGSSGIAVGMATNIPPHNLNEVVDALRVLIDNPRGDGRRSAQARHRAGLPDRRHPDHQREGPEDRADHRQRQVGVRDGPRPGPDPRSRRDRGAPGRVLPDRRHRAAVPGEQGDPSGEDRRAGAREADRGHLGHARRVRSPGYAPGDRAEA